MKRRSISVSLLYTPVVLMLMSFLPGERPAPEKPVYMDTSYTFEERATDLVSRLTIEEKQSLLGNTMAAVPRLGINAYNVWGEALHGVARMFNFNYESATSFPNSVALGAAWDPALIEREATAISDEARGVNHTVIMGLTYWSPVVEPARDPRWGRTGESYGEDPFLISQIAGGFIRGLMGYDPDYLKAVPCGKHYFANNSEFNRHTGSSNMDERDIREFYLSQYRKLIERDHLPAIMTCYNSVNNVPITSSQYYVDSVARKTYGLNGYVTGDCGAVGDIYTGHSYVDSYAEAAALALKAGVDTDCGDVFQTSAIDALHLGLIEESYIDRALTDIFTIRMRIGEFDPIEKVAYKGITPDVINSPENVALAMEVATKTPVLLKNNTIVNTEQKVLPLDPDRIGKIAVIGPMADRVVLGPYSGTPLESNMISPLEGIEAYLGGKNKEVEVAFSPGANTRSRSNLFYISKFGTVKSNGEAKDIDATAFEASSGGFSADNRDGISSLRRINDGSWTAYSSIDLSDVDSLTVDLMVIDAGGSIEARVGSASGNLLASFRIPGVGERDGSIFFRRYRTFRAKVNQLGLSGPQNICFVYHAPAMAAIDKETLEVAASSDVAIVFVGTDDVTASEESDRITLLLPGNQYNLIKSISEVNPRTVVVMQTLGMVEVDSFKDLENVPGIIWTGYNGQAQGTAMAKILFGDVNPGGKLNATWYRSVDDLPDIADYDLRGGSGKNGRTYWYFGKDISYEFGYGLSYTNFEYSNFRIDRSSISPNDKLTISVDVTNTGAVDGDEVVQVYVRTPDSPASLQRPIKRLKGFQRVSIPAGGSATVNIGISCDDLWFWDPAGERITFDQGRYLFEIGSSSEDIRGTVEAVMKGTYHAGLKTVVAECDKVVVNVGDEVQTAVSASMSDDSFYDIRRARVTYSSSNPDVLNVNEDGRVTAVGAGSASVLARVTIDDVSLSDSYALTVLPDLSLAGIRVNGKELEGFYSEASSYGILLKKAKRLPLVEATATGKDAVVEIDQIENIPGTAVIHIKDPMSGREKSCLVNFGLASRGDEFEGSAPGRQWEWIRENSDNWSLSEDPGALTITAQAGDLQGPSSNAKNILVQNANTDWVAESHVEFSRMPVQSGEQAGILAYQDDDNYVKLMLARGGGGLFSGNEAFIELAIEQGGGQFTAARVPVSSLNMNREYPSITFRLGKTGSTYTASYSVDGQQYGLLGSAEARLKDIKAGVYTCSGAPPADNFFAAFLRGQQREKPAALEVRFDYFHIQNIE